MGLTWSFFVGDRDAKDHIDKAFVQLLKSCVLVAVLGAATDPGLAELLGKGFIALLQQHGGEIFDHHLLLVKHFRATVPEALLLAALRVCWVTFSPFSLSLRVARV